MSTAVAYYRYSSHRQGEQSIEGQAKHAKDWASKHGCALVKEYADRAISGRSDDRAQFQLMLHELEKIKPDYLILWKVDRMGRNKEEIAYNKYRCKKAGVKVAYVAEEIPDTPEGVILESVLEGFAEYYSLQMAQNIRRGQRNAAEKCQVIGGRRILGYKTGANKQYEIDEDGAAIVRDIFKRYLAGESQTEIVNALNASGHRTLRGQTFTINSIRSLLKNEKYTGVYIWKDQIRVEGGMPAIIDHETWEKAQKLMRTNKKAPAAKETADYILTDKLFCGHCGGPMSGISGKSHTGAIHRYYTCSNRHRKRNASGCKKKNIRKEWIEETVLRHTHYLLHKEGVLEHIAHRCWEIYSNAANDTSYVDALKADLKETQTALDNLMKALEAGIFSASTKERLDQLEEKKQQLTEAIAEESSLSTLKLTEDHILYYLCKMREIPFDDPGGRQKLIDTFVNAIYVYDDKITLCYNYSGEDARVTLAELDTADVDSGFVPSALSSTKKKPPNRVVFLFSGYLVREAIRFEGKDPQVRSTAATKLRQHPKGADLQTHGGGKAAEVFLYRPPKRNHPTGWFFFLVWTVSGTRKDHASACVFCVAILF